MREVYQVRNQFLLGFLSSSSSTHLSTEEKSSADGPSKPGVGCSSCPMCGSVLVLSVQDPNLFQDNEDDDESPHNIDEKADYILNDRDSW